MGPTLRVLVSSDSAYPPSLPVTVNSSTPTPITTPNFKGEISVYIKDFSGEGGSEGGDGQAYFGKRSSMTYGIVVRGQFLDNPTADDVVFGNVFERPIKDSLPWGTSVAVKFMKLEKAYNSWVDPTLELDIYADKPWALSPALAGMSNVSLSKPNAAGDKHAWIDEQSKDYVDIESLDEKGEIAARRKYFADETHRKDLSLKDVEVGMEFANGLLDFKTLSATLPQPFHLSVPLLKYWDGQPVLYVCRRRSKTPVQSQGVYWSVGFEIVDEGAIADLEKRGGSVYSLGGEKAESVPGHGDASDDID